MLGRMRLFYRTYPQLSESVSQPFATESGTFRASANRTEIPSPPVTESSTALPTPLDGQTLLRLSWSEWGKGHDEYEHSVDGLIQSPPPINGQKQGMYMADLPTVGLVGCDPGKPSCFLVYAAKETHNSDVLDDADNGVYTAAGDAVLRAQRLQAGLYAAFLTDIDRRPVHMSAIVATF
jgi:hypothetical protein